ncbi:MAG: histone deacetylase family protein [Phenylobacterium sp.]|uniref:histone deacetylase family protein n=1 Tax=Phenylobacterium sp. TaxID=1871053 RepID=UPI001A5951F5|nr:histone deacetylase family protein [Phenylobacterium sp.]MBL8554841.1 histone deacetylase family protein [Phenylobacterium sp.]
MTVALYTHQDMFDHRPGDRHPERPERLRSVIDALDDAALDLIPHDAPVVEEADLLRVHDKAYVEEIVRLAPASGRVALDPDTSMSAGSLAAARRAAGAVVQAVRDVAAGKAERAFCAVRPPGHHAEPGLPMGFCIFSNVAVAAHAARAAGFGKVAVVDFDIHHGNGTQAALGGRDGLFFASIQSWPMWPGTGHPDEAVPANIVNAVSPEGAPAAVWRRAFEDLMGKVDAFAPDLVIVSAGFDAHARDPVGGGGQSLEEADFAWATRAIADVANRRAKGRVVSSLEGGYDLQALGRSALAHVRALGEG